MDAPVDVAPLPLAGNLPKELRGALDGAVEGAGLGVPAFDHLGVAFVGEDGDAGLQSVFCLFTWQGCKFSSKPLPHLRLPVNNSNMRLIVTPPVVVPPPRVLVAHKHLFGEAG